MFDRDNQQYCKENEKILLLLTKSNNVSKVTQQISPVENAIIKDKHLKPPD